MGVPLVAPPESALQTLIVTHNTAASPHPPGLQYLALQILHNLQHQHGWTELRIHYHSTHSDRRLLPRPLISGLPPNRLYIHPDEQIALLQSQKAAGKALGLSDLKPEREWVAPSHLREKWSLRRFGEIFDGIDVVPHEYEEDGEVADRATDSSNANGSNSAMTSHDRSTNPWRKEKRVLLATVDDDSTIVYYVVHDGIVKPRQN